MAYSMPDRKARVADQTLNEVFTQQQIAMERTRRAAETARRLLAGEMSAPVHKNVAKAGITRPIRLPYTRTSAQRVLQVLTEKYPRIKRYWTGLAKAAQETATEIEQPIDAAMKRLYPRYEVADNLLNESWCAISVVPYMADWLRTPVLLDSDGQIAKRWAKHASSNEEARQHHADAVTGHLARHLPFRISAHSIRNTGPIFGPNGELVGMVVKRSLNSIQAIEAGYKWGKGYLMQESDEVINRAGDVEMLEGFFTGADGHAYLSYSIEGHQTTREDLGDGSAVLDLTERYGIERLPIACDWGLGWGSSDPDMRGLTFTEPFRDGWLGAEALLTYMLAGAMFMGLPVLFEEENEMGDDDGPLDAGKTEPMQHLEPMGIHRARGKITQLQVEAFSPAMMAVFSQLIGANESELPSKQGMGAAGKAGQSAIAQTVSRAFAEDALGSVRKSDLRLYEKAASFVWEQGVAIGRKWEPVKVLANPDTLIKSTGRNAPLQSVLTIDPDLVPEDLSTADWDVHAELPADPGDNMPLTMMLSELHNQQKIPLEDLLERMGYPSPEQVVAKVEAEKLRSLPAYQAMQLRRIALVAGNDEEAEFYRLQAETLMAEAIGINGEAEIGPDGTPVRLPTGGIQGMNRAAAGGGAPAPHMTGMGAPNPVQASLAAHVGGAMGGGPASQAAAAGGAMPNTGPATSLLA